MIQQQLEAWENVFIKPWRRRKSNSILMWYGWAHWRRSHHHHRMVEPRIEQSSRIDAMEPIYVGLRDEVSRIFIGSIRCWEFARFYIVFVYMEKSNLDGNLKSLNFMRLRSSIFNFLIVIFILILVQAFEMHKRTKKSETLSGSLARWPNGGILLSSFLPCLTVLSIESRR